MSTPGPRLTRRLMLGRGLAAAGAAALPGSLIAADAALAQEDAETDALERLVELELAAELAYSLAAEDAELRPPARTAFEELGRYAGEHATALSAALEQLGVDPPESSDDPADYESLAEFDVEAPERRIFGVMTDVEDQLVAAYEEETPNLEAEDLIRSAAQIGAAHAQALVALRVLAGYEPRGLTALPPASTSASDTASQGSETAEE